MNNLNLHNFIKLKKEYEKVLNFNIIERCNKIVQAGAYTLATNKNNRVILSSSKFPMQFSDESVKELLKIKWESPNDIKPTVKVYNVKDWYGMKKEALDTIIDFYSKKN